MASEDDKIDLSSVAVTDLRKSLETLCQGSTLPPYNYDFPERFVQQRDLHFSHFSTTRIDGLKFFRESEYSGKSCPRFEQKEVTMTLDFVTNGRWLWFVPEQPSVSQSSVVSSVSQAEEVQSNGASATNDSDASQITLSTPGDISLASILQAMQAMETRIGTRFDSLEGRMATKDDLDLSEKKMQNMMHTKITIFATSIQRQLTAVEERLDARIDNLASDHNQLVSNVSVLSDRVDKVTTGAGGSLHTTITDSTGAAFSSVAVVPSETGNDNATLRTPGDYAPPPVRHLLHSTMVSAQGRVRYTSETVPTPSHKSPIFSLGDLDNISNIPSTGNNFRQGDVCQSTSRVLGGYGQVDNGVYRPYGRNESISYASPVQAQNFNMVQNSNFDRTQSNSIFETSRPSTSYVGANRSSFNHSRGNTSMRVKEPSVKMPTFDPKSNNWTTFIQDFEDLVNEMGWQGQEITKLKFCFLGDSKEIFRSLPISVQSNYEIVKKKFFSIYGDADERQANALKLYNCKQGDDQDLQSLVAQVTILANKAFPNDPVMADTMAIEYFLKGCKHQEAARAVIGSDRCKSLEEVSIEVRRLVDKFLFLDGSKDPVQVRAFSHSRSTAAESGTTMRESRSTKFSPERSKRNFSPTQSPNRSDKFSSTSTKVGMNDLFDQIQLMRGDFAHVDGKMADFDNKISAVQDNVSNLKSEIMRTPSQDRGALYKSPPRRQFFGSSPPRGDRSKSPDGRGTGSPSVCFRCRQPGHFIRECPEAASPGRSDKDKNWRSPASSPSKRVTFGEIKSTGQGLKA